jgi:hypothetical protein
MSCIGGKWAPGFRSTAQTVTLDPRHARKPSNSRFPWGPFRSDSLLFGRVENLALRAIERRLNGVNRSLETISRQTRQPCSEIEGPMALVILGGLVTSTALNLLGLPVLYRRFGEGAGARAREQEALCPPQCP